MSELLSPEREELYRYFQLEELLQDPEPVDPDQILVLDEHEDSFGNFRVLTWDPKEGVATLNIAGVSIQTSGEQAIDAIKHAYPLLAHEVGQKALVKYIQPTTGADAHL